MDSFKFYNAAFLYQHQHQLSHLLHTLFHGFPTQWQTYNGYTTTNEHILKFRVQSKSRFSLLSTQPLSPGLQQQLN